ncbi:DUF3781 domain-containing protein [uncultured Vagococcus sp.]|uniref:DUF3781 domain-containing protein n=1 Tax=uncultured Vagococcus sp. TaxID=189676 RepID=UPI0028D79148|nr:DUF3781 domain-containing protein [uncultured Vagococcus sp.]
MENIRRVILNNVCYTDLVYGRINKKLGTSLLNKDIEALVISLLSCAENKIEKIGKNFYIKDLDNKISLTINSYTYRVITADKLK